MEASGFATASTIPDAMAAQLKAPSQPGRRATNAETVAFIRASSTGSTLPVMQAFRDELGQFRASPVGSRHGALLHIIGWSFGMVALDLRWAMEQIRVEWATLTSGERREGEPDEIACYVAGREIDQRAARADQAGSPPGDQEASTLFVFEHAPDPFVIPPVRWLVEGLWCVDTYGELAGPQKSLKSVISTLIDVAVAAGVPVLGRFGVPQPARVLHLAGEGGRAGYWRRYGRACAAYGVDVGDVRPNLRVTFHTGPVTGRRFLDSVRGELETFGPALLHLDPWYSFAPGQADSRQLAEVGAALEVVRQLCAETGTSPLINNHFNQTGTGSGLVRITGAGHGEWVDSWLLTNHREPPDVPAGRFRLRLDVGSRQWGGTSWDLDLDLGRFDPLTGDHDGAIAWRVTEASAAGIDPQEAHDAKIAEAMLALTRKARRKKTPFQKTALCRETAGNYSNNLAAFDLLVEHGVVVEVTPVTVTAGHGSKRQVARFEGRSGAPMNPLTTRSGHPISRNAP